MINDDYLNASSSVGLEKQKEGEIMRIKNKVKKARRLLFMRGMINE